MSPHIAALHAKVLTPATQNGTIKTQLHAFGIADCPFPGSRHCLARYLDDKLRAATGIKVGGQSIGFSTYNEGRLFVYMLGLKEVCLSPPSAARSSIRR